MTIFVTGGCGFIGSAVVRKLIQSTDHTVVNIDKMTYAASYEAVAMCVPSTRYFFEKGDICDSAFIKSLFAKYKPSKIIHLAAESHVDRSISGPMEFIQTNIVGTSILLQEGLNYYKTLDPAAQQNFRFHHVSTDEVFGELDDTGFFTETTPYDPSSPYSASKASSDHLVRAWGRTFGLPYTLSNCTNNYGPYQHTEKMIPVMIMNCLEKKPLPVYGKGLNVRDWLYVEDHADALLDVVFNGKNAETYCIGGENEIKNIDVVHTICDLMDKLFPWNQGQKSHRDLITYVTDRPGHDYRYAMDISNIKNKLGWSPKKTFEQGLQETIEWYVNQSDLKMAV